MISWREIPFVRLILPFILGILLQDYLNINWSPVVGVSILCVFILLLLFFSRKKRRYSQRYVFGSLLFSGLILLGSFLFFLRENNNQPHHFKTYQETNVQLEGKVTWLKPGNKYIRVIIQVNKADLPDQTTPVTGKLLVYLPLSAQSMSINPGDNLKINKGFLPISTNKNPKAFDFARYWYLKNVHYQSFPQEEDWMKVSKEPSFSLFNKAMLIRGKLLQVLNQSLPTPNEFGVGASLILGERSGLNTQVKTAFAQTGSMHVLAVSGLHTGLVFLFVNFILGLFKIKGKWWKWIKALILLLAVWSFAFLTGASSSVLRSATMFSFVIIGNALNRSAIIYNTLAASAFCLLLFNPKFVFEPGFQLSYLAVLGIVYFQPKIYKKWYIKNKIGDYTWKLTSVSLAAQITTLPLSLFYFHQFPLYFWLSGLVVIPAAMVILPLGFTLFITHSIPFLGMMVGKLLYGVIWLLNSMIFQINSLPFGLIHGVWIGGLIVLLLYLLIIGVIGFISTKKAKWFIVSLLIFSVILFINVRKEWTTLHQSQLIVYHIPRSSLIDFIDREKVVSLTSKNLSEEKETYTASNNRDFLRTKSRRRFLLSDSTVIEPNFYKEKDLLQYRGKNMAILYPGHPPPVGLIKVPLLLVTQNAISSIAELRMHYDFETLIFDGSNSWKKVKAWKAEGKKLGINCYYTGEEGAYVIHNY